MYGGFAEAQEMASKQFSLLKKCRYFCLRPSLSIAKQLPTTIIKQLFAFALDNTYTRDGLGFRHSSTATDTVNRERKNALSRLYRILFPFFYNKINLSLFDICFHFRSTRIENLQDRQNSGCTELQSVLFSFALSFWRICPPFVPAN